MNNSSSKLINDITDKDIRTKFNNDLFVSKSNNIDVSNIKNNPKLLKNFYDNWGKNGKKEDLKNISELLEIKKRDISAGKKVNFDTYLYTQDNKLSDNDVFIPLEYSQKWGERVEHVTRRKDDLDYDYRITLSNSEKLTPLDTLSFLNALESRLEKRQLPLDFKYYGSSCDALILYLKKDDFFDYVNILEELKSNEEVSQIIPNFGEKKTFTGGIGENSYYGISLGSEHPIFSRIRGMKSLTMTNYSGKLMDYSFDTLMKKYDGNLDLISTSEMYSEMQRLHQTHQFGFTKNVEIPFWMNKDMYNDMLNAGD